MNKVGGGGGGGGGIGLDKNVFKRQKTVCEVGGIFIFVLEHCL